MRRFDDVSNELGRAHRRHAEVNGEIQQESAGRGKIALLVNPAPKQAAERSRLHEMNHGISGTKRECVERMKFLEARPSR